MDDLYKEILGDFFRHAFDGSGADNFFDAGSCIDGESNVGSVAVNHFNKSVRSFNVCMGVVQQD